MVKNKEWFKNIIYTQFPSDTTYSDYAKGLSNGLTICLKYIDQLEEPKKVVIPQFMADFIQSRKKEGLNIYGAISEGVENPYRENKEVSDWIIAPHYEGESSNQERFARAWLDGYEVEKEKMYYLRLRDEDLPLYKAYDMNIWKYKLVYSAHHLRNENFLTVTFSESEIENMDIRSFELEEVTE